MMIFFLQFCVYRMVNNVREFQDNFIEKLGEVEIFLGFQDFVVIKLLSFNLECFFKI